MEYPGEELIYWFVRRMRCTEFELGESVPLAMQLETGKLPTQDMKLEGLNWAAKNKSAIRLVVGALQHGFITNGMSREETRSGIQKYMPAPVVRLNKALEEIHWALVPIRLRPGHWRVIDDDNKETWVRVSRTLLAIHAQPGGTAYLELTGAIMEVCVHKNGLTVRSRLNPGNMVTLHNHDAPFEVRKAKGETER